MEEIKEGYDRVTAVLSPFSGLTHIAPEILKRAGERGTAVHRAIDAYINGLGVWIEPEYQGYFDSFMSWWGDGYQTVPNHGRLYDDHLMITGECDLLIKNGNELKLVDFKTSSSVGKTWGMQGAAYLHMLTRYYGNITSISFVHLKKDGKKSKEIFYTYEENWNKFLKCLDIYREFFKTKNPMDFDI